jgi:methyl-accepting chemotaxis protein
MSETHPMAAQAGEVLKSLQQMASLISQAAADTAQAAATAGAHATPPFLAGPLAEIAEGIAGLSENLTGPLRRLLEEQQRLADLMADWSEQHRRLTEQMQRVVKPVLEQAEGMAKTTRVFVEELRN